MKKKTLFLTLLLGAVTATTTQAQELYGYGFGETVGTYEEITDGVVVYNGGDFTTSSKDFYEVIFLPSAIATADTTGAGYDMGFAFRYNGKDCDQFVISPAGYVQVGVGEIETKPSAGNYVFNKGVKDFFGCPSFYGTDTTAETAISYKLVGEAPAREMVVQYKNLRILTSWGDTVGVAADMQIRMKESGDIAIVFNNLDFGTNKGGFRLGLGGDNGKDYVTRTDSLVGSKADTPGSISILYQTGKVADGFTLTFTAPAACTAPTAQPTALALAPTSTSFSGAFETTEADMYLVLMSADETLAALPANGTTYAAGDSIADALVLSWSANATFESPVLPGSTTYYVTVMAANSYCSGGPIYNTDAPLAASVKTLPSVPADLTFTARDASSITFDVTGNEAGDNVIVVYSTEVERVNTGNYGLTGPLVRSDYAAGDSIDGGGVVAYVGPSATGITVSGLASGPGYHFKAYSMDADGVYSSDTLIASAATYIVAPYALDYANVFKYEMPADWTFSEVGKWYTGQKSSKTGGTSDLQITTTGFKGVATGAELFVMPQPIVVEKAHTIATFTYTLYYGVNRFSSAVYNDWNEGDTLALQVTTDGVTFDNLTLYTADSHPTMGDLNASTMGSFLPLAADLSAYVGQTVSVRFYWKTSLTSGFNVYAIIDMFTVEEADSYAAPAPVLVIGATPTTATLTWQSAAQGFEVAYWKTTEGADTTVVVVGDVREVTLDSLDFATTYEAKIRAVVDDSTFTEWSDVVAFTTAECPACEAPADLTADVSAFAEQGVVTLSWTASKAQLSWDVRYRVNTSTEYAYCDSLTEPTVTLTDLVPGLTYLWSVRAACTYDRTSVWATQSSFETPVATGISALATGRAAVTAAHGYVSVLSGGRHIDGIEVYSASGALINLVAVGGTDNALIPVASNGYVIVRVITPDGTSTYKVRP